MERTPAKTRKNKRELDGTPDTPQTPCTPSSDSDIMSPPPIKRTRSRRELCPLMEQQHNKPENRQPPSHHHQHHHYIQRRDENACLSPAECGVDENKFGESQQRPQRPMPASPMLSRVLRNTENLQSPIKNPTYSGFDMDGIKPLPEVDDRLFIPNVVTETLPTAQDAPHLSTHEPDVVLSMAFPSTMPLNNAQLALPPEQLLEEDQMPGEAWHCPDLPIKMENPLKTDGTFVPVDISDVVLSLPVAQAHPPNIEEDPQKQSPADDSSPQSDKSPQSEEWRMRQPKKRWLREVLRLEQGKLEVPAVPLVEMEGQAQPSVVTKATSQPFSPVVTQPNAGETKEKWMGAMALIQLAEVPDEGPQPLNLSTARYTML